jgi:hypothetical protein
VVSRTAPQTTLTGESLLALPPLTNQLRAVALTPPAQQLAAEGTAHHAAYVYTYLEAQARGAVALHREAQVRGREREREGAAYVYTYLEAQARGAVALHREAQVRGREREREGAAYVYTYLEAQARGAVALHCEAQVMQGSEAMEGKIGRRQCTQEAIEWERQHLSATSPSGSFLSGGAPLQLEVPRRGHLPSYHSTFLPSFFPPLRQVVGGKNRATAAEKLLGLLRDVCITIPESPGERKRQLKTMDEILRQLAARMLHVPAAGTVRERCAAWGFRSPLVPSLAHAPPAPRRLGHQLVTRFTPSTAHELLSECSQGRSTAAMHGGAGAVDGTRRGAADSCCCHTGGGARR